MSASENEFQLLDQFTALVLFNFLSKNEKMTDYMLDIFNAGSSWTQIFTAYQGVSFEQKLGWINLYEKFGMINVNLLVVIH